MSIVDAHQLRSFLVVGYAAESASEFGMVQEQLQSADNNKRDNEHQTGQHPYSYAGREVDVQSFQITGLQSPAVGAEDLQQSVLQKNA
jgi:hypothetical protein